MFNHVPTAALRPALCRAVHAAHNAALDAAEKGWWTHSIALPVRYRKGNGWLTCRSVHWTTKFDGQYVPSGALLAAALKAASRALGVKPNNKAAIQIAIQATAIAGDCDLSQFAWRDLVALR